MFHGGWHGGIDGLINSKGVPPTTSELIKVLPYNDEDCFNEITPDLAAIIIEPKSIPLIERPDPLAILPSILITMHGTDLAEASLLATIPITPGCQPSFATNASLSC